jgi:hypothetical protein
MKEKALTNKSKNKNVKGCCFVFIGGILKDVKRNKVKREYGKIKKGVRLYI